MVKRPANNRQSWLSIEQIRAARALADLTQEQAAEVCGVPYPSWRTFEKKRGRFRIQALTMARIQSGFRTRGVEFERYGVSFTPGFCP
jgi:hypothetical protein